jgi:hypothetical protein
MDCFLPLIFSFSRLNQIPQNCFTMNNMDLVHKYYLQKYIEHKNILFLFLFFFTF